MDAKTHKKANLKMTLSILFLLSITQLTYANSSILDSGKTPQEIAAEILKSAKERHAREEQQKNKVTMYSTSWCGYCRKARNYFHSKDIKFREYNIENNMNAKKRYDLLRGSGVPLIVVGGKVMRGFSIRRFEKLYN